MTSGKRHKFLASRFIRRIPTYILRGLFSSSPRGNQRQRGGVRYSTLFLRLNRFANVILPLSKNTHGSVKEAKGFRVALKEHTH